eukprot:Skav204033  [mRNA]  locus=scaffold1162:96792:98950:- [translate_table: standard]
MALERKAGRGHQPAVFYRLVLLHLLVRELVLRADSLQFQSSHRKSARGLRPKAGLHLVLNAWHHGFPNTLQLRPLLRQAEYPNPLLPSSHWHQHRTKPAHTQGDHIELQGSKVPRHLRFLHLDPIQLQPMQGWPLHNYRSLHGAKE